MPDLDLGKALAPSDEIFEVVEDQGVPDPLVGGDLEVAENPLGVSVSGDIPAAELSTLPEKAIELSNALDQGDIEIVEPNSVQEIAPVDDSVEIEEVPELSVTSPTPTVDYADPGELVSAVLKKARTFAEYDLNSTNSLRRASALCDGIEKLIIAGVTQDSEEQKLSLAQLKLLDDIEEGIHYTRSYLNRSSKKQVLAGRVGDHAFQNGAYDPFCSTVARVLINAQVQGGKKVQDVFGKLKSQYGINEREQLQIRQIMLDMGYPVQGSLIDGSDMVEQLYA
jgi:hypothetical protein